MWQEYIVIINNLFGALDGMYEKGLYVADLGAGNQKDDADGRIIVVEWVDNKMVVTESTLCTNHSLLQTASRILHSTTRILTVASISFKLGMTLFEQ